MGLNMFGFGRKAAETGFSPVYNAQKLAWNERYAIHAQSARRWQATSFSCIALAAGMAAWTGYLASQPKFVPYIVEEDHLGEQRAVGVAPKLAPTDLRTIQNDIRRWVENVRTVSVDAQDQKKFIWEAANHTNEHGPAWGELMGWWKDHYPFDRAKSEKVTVTINSILPREANQWKLWVVKWKEETRTRSGELIGKPEDKEASITMTYRAPKSDNDFRINPTGNYVDDFDWTK